MANRKASRILIVSGVAGLLSGCAMLQPPPVPGMPTFGFSSGSSDASCTADIARAHVGLAAAGSAAGDPAATAAAHAVAAGAMASYTSCLARSGQP